MTPEQKQARIQANLREAAHLASLRSRKHYVSALPVEVSAGGETEGEWQ